MDATSRLGKLGMAGFAIHIQSLDTAEVREYHVLNRED